MAKMFVVFTLMAVLALGTVDSKQIKLPSGFIEDRGCKQNDPQFDKCLLKLVEDIRPYLNGGIPQYAVPAIDPFTLKEFVVSLGENTGIKGTARNIVAQGGRDFKITKLKISDDRLTYKVGVEVPLMTYQYDYDVNIDIALIPIKGRGIVRGNTTNIKADIIGYAVMEKRADGNHIRFKKFDVRLDAVDGHVMFTNSYKGETILSQATNTAINENYRSLMKLALPLANQIMAYELPKYVNNITDTFVFDDLFPVE